MTRRPLPLGATLSAFADRVLLTGGRDPGDEVLPVPASRLEIYRGLVRGNYRSMLVFSMTCTLRLLQYEMDDRPAANGDRTRDDVMARLLATAPASTHSTREIAERFAAFVPAAYPDLVARRPELPELMELERAELRALYHPDDPGDEAAPEQIDALRALSVDEFLATRVVRAPSASLLRFAYPVKALRDELDLRHHPPAPSPSAEHVTVSRVPVSLDVTLRTLPAAGLAALAWLAAGESAPLEEVAGRWLSEPREGVDPTDEGAAFRLFGDTVLAALADGVLRLA